MTSSWLILQFTCIRDNHTIFLTPVNQCLGKWKTISHESHGLVMSSEWRHNERHGVSNHRRLDCLLNRLFRCRSKKHQSSASLAFVRGSLQWSVNFPHKGPVTRKMFQFDDVIMITATKLNADKHVLVLYYEIFKLYVQFQLREIIQTANIFLSTWQWLILVTVQSYYNRNSLSCGDICYHVPINSDMGKMIPMLLSMAPIQQDIFFHISLDDIKNAYG